MTSRTDDSRIRFLLATAETHPTHRPDVRVLFGKYLPQFGVESDLVAAVAAGNGEAPAWGGGTAFLRPARGRVGQIVVDVLQQLSLFRRCLVPRYAGLIVRDKPFLGVLGFLAARLGRIPFVYWMSFPMSEADLAIARTNDGTVRWSRRLHTWARGRAGAFVLYRILAPRADHLFVQSPLMLEHLRGRGLRHQRVSTVPMGVDFAALPAASRAVRRESPSGPVGVYLGTLNRLRRRELEIMVDAAQEVAKTIREFTLLVIGESEAPSERGWLQRYADERGAGHCVRFTGWVPYEEGLKLAGSATVGLSPVPRGPLFDMGCPTKAIEYMALGLPVVCNDQPDQQTVVQESDGGLCVELTASAFASAIVELLSSPGRTRAMGAAGRNWVLEHRDYRSLAQGVAQTLKSLGAAPDLQAAASRPGSARDAAE